jgi:hypothetical protein
MKAFNDESLRRFEAHYPEQPIRIDHGLADHPLLRIEALAELASRMRPADVEYNRGDVPVGLDPAATPSNGLSIAETIHSIEHCGSWMVLKFIEQDPAYRALLQATLAELEPIVKPVTGPMLKPEGFIFLSSPDAVTPFHFDPEHNILLQIRGNKVMNVFPAGDERFAPGEAHETFHSGGHRNLTWKDEFAPLAKPVRLDPGQAVHVPVKAPHWVRNGSEVSISLSVTWRSYWSYRESYARQMNRLLRKAGVRPASPGRFPKQNHVKSLAYWAIEKAQRLAGLES